MVYSYQWFINLNYEVENSQDDFVCNLSYGIYYKTVSSPMSFKEVMEHADVQMYEMKKAKKKSE